MTPDSVWFWSCVLGFFGLIAWTLFALHSDRMERDRSDEMARIDTYLGLLKDDGNGLG